MLKSIQRRKNRLSAQKKARVRSKVSGTAELPRLSVYKSNKYFYAQAINDLAGHTLASVDGRKLGLKCNQEDVKEVAKKMAENLKAVNVESIKFDRNGYLYHGVVASFAEALREAGIKF